MIRISLNSIFVDDQQKALEFYTDKIGFHKKEDAPIGEHRWITVCNKGDDFELVLEPDAHPAAKAYKEAIYKDGIPATMFYVDDINTEYKKLIDNGVQFKSEPVEMGAVKIALFDDTCGNYISLCEKLS